MSFNTENVGRVGMSEQELKEEIDKQVAESYQEMSKNRKEDEEESR